MSRMRIWKLTPKDPSDPVWKDWSSKPTFVRADAEGVARKLAASRTTQATPIRRGQPVPLNPWETFASTCEDVTEPYAGVYSVDGPPAVLRLG
jgi:hypothetical protein